MVKMSIFDKTNDLLLLTLLKMSSKKKQRSISARCHVDSDNQEVDFYGSFRGQLRKSG